MPSPTSIEWTESTWNPVTGCTKISAGCEHCYAERMARRLKAMGQSKYRNGFGLTLHEDLLEEPLSWKSPRIVFTCSMGDLFHEDVPDDFISRAFGTMGKARRHVFQVLTKRSERLMKLAPKLDWRPNIWMGVTVENGDYTFRIDHLRKTGARVKFLSVEPLLGGLKDFDPDGIDWVIVGGESGPRARVMRKSWVLDIRDRCIGAGVPFFFKQWGGFHRKKNGRLLENRTWNQMPEMFLPGGAQLEFAT